MSSMLSAYSTNHLGGFATSTRLRMSWLKFDALA